MRLIAHRGNINGPNPARENTIDYIDEALAAGYEVEVDVWYNVLENTFYLGHDGPIEPVSAHSLANSAIWCHAKNAVALRALLSIGAHCFMHDTDDAVLTSNKHIWTYPGKELVPNAICVLPESVASKPDYEMCSGICSDYVINYKYLKGEE